MLKQLRGLKAYSQTLRELSRYAPVSQINRSSNASLFVRFVNMMMNDSHYLLDEVWTKLPEIRQIEAEMEDTNRWMAQDEVFDNFLHI